mgnify:CR=1 FL=1
MKMERAFVNWEEGFAVCCWSAPSEVDLAGLFEKAGVPFERIIQVQEMGG